PPPHSFPTRRSSDLDPPSARATALPPPARKATSLRLRPGCRNATVRSATEQSGLSAWKRALDLLRAHEVLVDDLAQLGQLLLDRSEEHTSELQSREN